MHSFQLIWKHFLSISWSNMPIITLLLTATSIKWSLLNRQFKNKSVIKSTFMELNESTIQKKSPSETNRSCTDLFSECKVIKNVIKKKLKQILIRACLMFSHLNGFPRNQKYSSWRRNYLCSDEVPCQPYEVYETQKTIPYRSGLFILTGSITEVLQV